jgi:replication-associated recombination protein RarA
MKDLLLHTQTREALEKVLSSRPHAIMITGNPGSGKSHIALKLAGELLGMPAEKHAYFLNLEPAGKSFTIDQVRELKGHMRLKTTGNSYIRRVVLLNDVHTMTVEAQNALLKLLEEPPEDTVLILTAVPEQSLKPTIYSRVQKIQIRPISKEQAKKALGSTAERLYDLSGGDVGLLTSLIKEDKQHSLVSAIADAKKLLTDTPFERLTKVDELAKDKDSLKTILAAMKRIARVAIKAALLKNNSKNARRWTRILECTHQTEIALHANVNPKLALSELFLSI